MKKIAIIGAGLSGTTLFRYLQEHFDVTLFEKARGAGGRMSTRRADPFQFDHGAQHFTVRDERFRSFLEPWIQDGVVCQWDPEIVRLSSKGAEPIQWNEPHYVVSPRMNALCKALLSDASSQFNTACEIRDLELTRDHQWRLIDKENQSQGEFDWVISTAPVEQSLNLLPTSFADVDLLKNASMTACFSLMLGLQQQPDWKWQAANVNDDECLQWIALNSEKPGRDTSPSLLVHSRHDWSQQTIEQPPEVIQEKMLRQLIKLTGLPEENIVHSALHRWRFAAVEQAVERPYLIDHQQQLAACGDWCIEGRVEAAFLSAHALAQALIEHS